MAKHVAGVQCLAPRLAHLRQAQDAAHQLRHGALAFAGGQGAQHIGKGAVPALLQRLLGDDHAHLAGGREQFLVANFVFLAGFFADVGIRKTQLRQKRARILRVDIARIHLVFAGALHLHQHDGPDVAPGLALQLAGFTLQRIELACAFCQAALPIHPAAHIHMDGQLDHLRRVQVGAAHIHQNVGATGARRLGVAHARRGR